MRRVFAGELCALVGLAVPLALGQLGMHLMGLVDTAMLGHYSKAALAGSGVANALLLPLAILGMGTVMGLDTLIPQAVGAGDSGHARALCRAGLRVAVLIGVPLTAASALTPPILDLAEVDPDIAAAATIYLYGRLPGMIPILLFTALRSYLQAHNITRPIVIAMIAANLVNVAADAVLIFGDGALTAIGLPAIGLPALGAVGAAIASSVVMTLACGITALAVRNHMRSQPATASRGENPTRQIISLGLPVGLQLAAEVGLFAMTGILAGGLGEILGAAHHVALSVASFTFSAAVGIGAATSVRVGHAVGARDAMRTRHAGAAGIVAVSIFMAAIAVAFTVFAAPIADIFAEEAAVVATAATLLHIAALFQIVDGIQAAAGGALRGIGATRSTLVAHLIGLYAIGAPVAIGLTFAGDLGARGLWWGLCAGLSTVAVILVARFFHLVRRPVAAQTPAPAQA